MAKKKKDPHAQWRDKDGFIQLQLLPGKKIPIGVKGKRNKLVYPEDLPQVEYEGKATDVDIQIQRQRKRRLHYNVYTIKLMK